MKAIIVLIICIAISFYSFAEIKNGYKQEIYKAEQTLKNLKIVMDDVIDNEDLYTPVKTRYILVKGELNFLLKSHLPKNKTNALRLLTAIRRDK